MPVSVSLEKEDGQYVFHRVKRDLRLEKRAIQRLEDLGLPINRGQLTMPKLSAFSWLHDHREMLEKEGFEIIQHDSGDKKYFLGT